MMVPLRDIRKTRTRDTSSLHLDLSIGTIQGSYGTLDALGVLPSATWGSETRDTVSAVARKMQEIRQRHERGRNIYPWRQLPRMLLASYTGARSPTCLHIH